MKLAHPTSLILSSLSFSVLVVQAQFHPENPLELKTPQGTILGTYETVVHGTARAFYGVPFAVPPVGSKRFTYPELYGPTWKNGFINGSDASLSPFCFQAPTGFDTPYIGSEDCLYIDIWVPEHSTSTDKLPVLVMIPGGGYVGTGNLPAADFVASSQATIVAFIHYRVNVFGFLSTRGLSQETAPYQSSGNYGMADWTVGLQWIHKNIASFGGDPNRVTLQGLSAGAFAVNIAQVQPMLNGLYQQAIIDSGGSDQSTTVSSLEEKEFLGQSLAAAVGCTWDQVNDPCYTLQNACLRNVSKLDLLNSFNWLGYELFYTPQIMFPAPDGWWLPDWPQTLYTSGKFHDVPILAGSALDEMSAYSFTPTLPTNATNGYTYNTTTYDEVIQWCSRLSSKLGLGVDAGAALTAYYLDPNRTFDVIVAQNLSSPVGTSSGPYAALVEITSGNVFQCPVRRNLRYQAMAKQPSYGYAYGYRSIAFPIAAFAEHGTQSYIAYTPTAQILNDTKDAFISHAIGQYWMSFIINGNPNNSTGLNLTYGVNHCLPEWPSQTDTNDVVLRIGNHDKMQDTTITALNGVYKYCDLQDSLTPYYSYAPRCAAGHSLRKDSNTCH